MHFFKIDHKRPLTSIFRNKIYVFVTTTFTGNFQVFTGSAASVMLSTSPCFLKQGPIIFLSIKINKFWVPYFHKCFSGASIQPFNQSHFKPPIPFLCQTKQTLFSLKQCPITDFRKNYLPTPAN